MRGAIATWSRSARKSENEKARGRTGLAEAVARNLFKLMAYKDEYEVARLYTDGNFRKQVETTFEPGSLRFEFHLAPPLLARKDKTTGEPRKMSFGPWIMTAFGLLKRLKGLRGTAFDPFGYTAERRTERKLISDYEGLMTEVLGKLNADNHPLAVGLAVIPEKIRGFGHVKLRKPEGCQGRRSCASGAIPVGCRAHAQGGRIAALHSVL